MAYNLSTGFNTSDDMFNKMDLLTLVVALSAYLAGVRFFAMQRLAEGASNSRALKSQLFYIVFADVFLVGTGVVLIIWIFFYSKYEKEAWKWGGGLSYSVGIIFLIAVVILVFYHFKSWWKSYREWKKLIPAGSTKSEREAVVLKILDWIEEDYKCCPEGSKSNREKFKEEQRGRYVSRLVNKISDNQMEQLTVEWVDSKKKWICIGPIKETYRSRKTVCSRVTSSNEKFAVECVYAKSITDDDNGVNRIKCSCKH